MRLSKIVGVLAVGVVLSGCVSTSVAANVNGKVISSSQLMTEVNDITANQAFLKQLEASQQVYGTGVNNSTYSMTFVDEVLNRRVSMDLIEQEAQKLGIKLTSQDIALGRVDAEQTFGGTSVFNQFSKEYQAQLIKDSAYLDVVEARLVNANISLNALRSYYSAHAAEFDNICSSQIIVSTQAEANSLYQQLQGGANFAALAKSSSGDPNTAPNGGAVGCGTYANYVSALGSQFAQIVKNMAANSIAPPSHLPSGWAIIQVTSRSTLPFDQLTPQIRAAILGTKGQNAITSLLSKRATAATVKVSSRYGQVSFGGSGTGSGVSPLPSPTPAQLNFFVPSGS